LVFRTNTSSNRYDLVFLVWLCFFRFGWFFWFDSVFSGFSSVFSGLAGFLFGSFFVWLGFFLVWLFFSGFRLKKWKPNRTSYFFQNFNRFNWFFFTVRFFWFFFRFSWFFSFFLTPIIYNENEGLNKLIIYFMELKSKK